ncbi:DUF2811 domain-containing protein [Xenorhabdus sp. BG5]|nr:DUF2811 domain-containing protein [Xenorhabdus sp. BG5]
MREVRTTSPDVAKSRLIHAALSGFLLPNVSNERYSL